MTLQFSINATSPNSSNTIQAALSLNFVSPKTMNLSPRSVEPNAIPRWRAGAFVLWRRNWLAMGLVSLLYIATPLLYTLLQVQLPILVDLIATITGTAAFLMMGVVAVRTKYGSCGLSDVHPSISLGWSLFKAAPLAYVPVMATLILLAALAIMKSGTYVAIFIGEGAETFMELALLSPPTLSAASKVVSSTLSILTMTCFLIRVVKCPPLCRVFFSSYGVTCFETQQLLNEIAFRKNHNILGTLFFKSMLLTIGYSVVTVFSPMLAMLVAAVGMGFLTNFMLVMFMDMMGDDTDLKVKEFKTAFSPS